MKVNEPMIVGVGASAGGIPALEGFFRGVPQDSGMAFVVVTHLVPERENSLHQVIGNHARMPVELVSDGLKVKPNVVYVMPENVVMSIKGGRLRLIPSDADRRERKPVDVFLSSLAEDQGDDAVGIILSGGDLDGTLGVKAIKERGGITLAEAVEPPGQGNLEMPASAITIGLIDYAVPVEDMAERLSNIYRDRQSLDNFVERSVASEVDQRRVQDEISSVLRLHTGYDFTGYKGKTFMRRVARRMQALQIVGLENYLILLREDVAEATALFRSLLINVTAFFRDPDAYEALRTKILPSLLDGIGADETVRVWVPGCSTGEEVYSIAILILEYLGPREPRPRVQIFATDINVNALAVARTARYPEALVRPVSPERLERFFRRDGASYVVRNEVREMCIFSPHSLIGDPPFSRMDLVSCRNLLIYLGGPLQSQVIPTLQYALKPGGFLFLGMSESIGAYSDLFTPIDKNHRIYQSRGTRILPRRPLLASAGSGFRPQGFDPLVQAQDNALSTLTRTVEAQVLDRHAPAHVVVNEAGEILYFSSQVTRFLDMPRGVPSRQLLDVTRRELRPDLRTALRQASETDQPVRREVVLPEEGGVDAAIIEISVELVEGNIGPDPIYLVLFSRRGTVPPVPASVSTTPEQEKVSALETDLRLMRERLQTTVEEYESAMEELRSSNEELVSVNEEAQSSNEELEASKEEMQSLNEELTTINAELTISLDELDRTTTDLKNLYAASQIATIFLDDNLVIRNFTPAASAFFRLRDADIGRPLTDLAGVLDYPQLQGHVRQVFSTGIVLEHRLTSEAAGQRNYLVRHVPYRDRNEVIEGVVVTFVDITLLAAAEAQLKVLVAELNHRSKNMLAVVISIAKSTMTTASSPEAFYPALLGRLHAMARAYSLISNTLWTEVSIRDLISAEAEVHGPGRFDIQGEDIHLLPRQALPMGMVFHELSTNAARFGALTAPEGRVDMRWAVRDGLLGVEWTESGGPVVTELDRNGFGLVLIRGQLQQLDGTVEFSFGAQGFSVRMSFPLSQ